MSLIAGAVGVATTLTDGVQGVTNFASGITLASGSTLANYAEGTWTPSDQSGAGLSFTVTDAFYTRVGRVVFVQAAITFPSNASGLSVTIGGLPFTVKSGSNNSSTCSFSTNANRGTDVITFVRNNTHFVIQNNSNNTDATNANYSTFIVRFGGWYSI